MKFGQILPFNNIWKIVFSLFWIFHIFHFLANLAKILVKIMARGGGFEVKKTSLAHIKVKPVMELLLFTELQNLRLWRKYGTSKFGGITQSHTKYRGLNDQYFKSLSVQTCLKVRFYQVLHVSVSFMCRNVESRFLNFWFFLRYCRFSFKIADFWQKTPQ